MKKNIAIVFAVLVGIGAMATLGRSGSSESFSARLNTSGNSAIATAQSNANTAPATTVKKSPKVKVPKKNQSAVPPTIPTPTETPPSAEPTEQVIPVENNEPNSAPASETKSEPTAVPAVTPAQPPATVEPTPTPAAPSAKKVEIHENPEPEIHASFNCGSNVYNCDDFSSHEEAQRVFEYCMEVAGKDVHGLDGDDDGSACEKTPPPATQKVAPETTSIESSSNESPPPSSGGCCKYCTKGKACGDSCISKSYTCHKAPGCACDS